MIISTIHEVLEKFNLSITDFSKASGLNRATISAIMNRTSTGIRFDTIEAICSVLSLDIDDLLIFLPYKDIEVNKDENKIIFHSYFKEIKPLTIKYELVTSPKGTYSYQISSKYLISYQNELAQLKEKQSYALSKYLSDILSTDGIHTGRTFDRLELLEILNRAFNQN